MKAPLIPALVVGLAIAGTLSGCSRISESRFNPLNWFGSSEPVAATLAPEGGYAQAAEDHRQPAAQITRMDLQRVSGGAVLLVTGVAPSLGWWDAELVPAEVSDRPVDGTLAYRLMIAAPRPGSADASRAGTQQTREITVQHFISEVKLAQVNRLVVEGANGARSMRR